MNIDDFIWKILFIGIRFVLSRNRVECNKAETNYIGPTDLIDSGLGGNPRALRLCVCALKGLSVEILASSVFTY